MVKKSKILAHQSWYKSYFHTHNFVIILNLKVPVGPGTLGRILNVIGEPVDEQGPVEGNVKAPIHRPAPLFTEQGKSQEILVTGITY